MKMESDEDDSTGSESNIWDDPQYDICLLESIEVVPPLGYHRPFAVVNICAAIKKVMNKDVSVAEIEKRLNQLYNLKTLERDAIDVLTLKSATEMEDEGDDVVDLDFELSSEYLNDLQAMEIELEKNK